MIDNLEIIKIKVKELEKETANKDNRIVKKLQEINECFLQNYMLQIDDLKIYPVEIESYYYSNFFKDEIVHQYHLQRDKEHLGKIYFHRYKNSNKINFCRGGFDICLSQNNFSNNKEGYCLSLLIRSAYINKELICGINKLLIKMFNIKSKKNISKQIINEYERLENLEVLKKRDAVFCRGFVSHPRISGNKYFYEIDKYKNNQIVKYNLNTLVLDELKNLKNSFYTEIRKKDILQNKDLSI